MFIKKTAIFCGEKERRGIITLINNDGIGTVTAKLYNTKQEDKLLIKFSDDTTLQFLNLTPIMSKKINKKDDFCCAIYDTKVYGKGKTNGYDGEELTIDYIENIGNDKYENKKVEESFEKIKEDAFDGEVAVVNYYQNALPKDISMDAGKIIENEKSKYSENENLSNSNKNIGSNEKKTDKDSQNKGKEAVYEENRKLKREIDKGENYAPNFYNEIKPQLDALFEKFPSDDYLNSIIPSSKWVMVDYDGEGKRYSVGVLTDGEDVLFIGYGVLSTFGEMPTQKIKSNYQWIPKDFNNPKGEGYYMIYQKATDGSNA